MDLFEIALVVLAIFLIVVAVAVVAPTVYPDDCPFEGIRNDPRGCGGPCRPSRPFPCEEERDRRLDIEAKR